MFKKDTFPAVQQMMSQPTAIPMGPKSSGILDLIFYKKRMQLHEEAEESRANIAASVTLRIEEQLKGASLMLNAEEFIKADYSEALERQVSAKARASILLSESEKKKAEAKGALIEMSKDELEFLEFKRLLLENKDVQD